MNNMRFIIFFIGMFVLNWFLAYGQNSKDYVILRPNEKTIQYDTIFGEIEMPKKGVFWNIKIQTKEGFKKFKNREVVGVQVEGMYFASIIYGKGCAIVPRLIGGRMELYYNYTGGSDRYQYVNQSEIVKEGFSGIPPYDLSQIIWDATSHFYITHPTTNEFHKIPRSNKKFREETSILFLDNPEIYNRISTGELGVENIIELVKLYNEIE